MFAAIIVGVSLASAQTAALQATCAASVSNNTITWLASASGGVAPYAYLWSGDAGVASSTSTSTTATYGANSTYSASVRVTDASSSVANGSCSGTITYFSTSSTTTHVSVNLSPQLQIGPNGNFLARDLIVQSVGSNSFTGTVWGITYTVNVSSSTNGRRPDFYLRGGNSGGTFSLSQLLAGDQLGVTGQVATSSPLVVNADVVRDYSITVLRTGPPSGNPNGPLGGKGKENGKNEGSGNNGNESENGITSSSINGFSNRLNQLFGRLQNLQNLFRSRFEQ